MENILSEKHLVYRILYYMKWVYIYLFIFSDFLPDFCSFIAKCLSSQIIYVTAELLTYTKAVKETWKKVIRQLHSLIKFKLSSDFFLKY